MTSLLVLKFDKKDINSYISNYNTILIQHLRSRLAQKLFFRAYFMVLIKSLFQTFIVKNFKSDSVASAFAIIVLEHPGGP
jgi:hypothetical protein